MKVEKAHIPKKSLLLKHTYNYSDSFRGVFMDPEDDADILIVSKAFFTAPPRWIDKLLILRNKIVSVFGLKTGGGINERNQLIQSFRGEIGDQVGVFKVFERSDDEIILGEDDAHLNFRVSILLQPKSCDKKDLIISTVVSFNNWYGKLYFLVVKPFHKLIVPAMLKSTIKELAVQY